MKFRGKSYKAQVSKIEKNKLYTKEEAIKLVKEVSNVKFDATIEVAMNLNLDVKKADQQLRGAIVLPKGTGKILGPKGLMPNPKTGTVTTNVKQAVLDAKAGKLEYRTDSYGNVHGIIGKVSFSDEDLKENLDAFVKTIIKAKPQAAKGTYVKSISICSTMSPAVRIDQNSFDN